MYSLVSFCDLQLWQIILSWVLPFLLGFFLGWLLWGNFKRRYKKAINDRDDFEQLSVDLEAKLDECIKMKEDQQDVIDILRKRLAESKVVESLKAKTVQPALGISLDVFKKIDEANLQIIEGIGPKMSEFLHGKGINNWKTLGEYDEDYLKKLMSEEGGRYRIINPETWPKQATLAASGNWNELISYQKQLSGGKAKGSTDNDSKVEKILIRMGLLKKWKKDDLKAVEGIGPKIEKLLSDAGVTTWKELSGYKVERLQEILKNGGSKFQLADPATWPEQAKLADEANWQALILLQDELKGGRKV